MSADKWLTDHGFVDNLQWRNSNADHLVDLLNDEGIEFVEAVVGDHWDAPGEPFAAYEFGDGSVIIVRGDKWFTFAGHENYNEEEDLWLISTR